MGMDYRQSFITGEFSHRPGATHVLPVLTPIAAAAVAAESGLISGFYLYYRDSSPMVSSVAMAIMAAFITYGRFALKPF